MKYNLNNEQDISSARLRLEELILNEALIDITKKHPTRSVSQNSYLHLLLGICALEMGENLKYFKNEIWKKLINPDLFEYDYTNRITGVVRKEYKSSADLDKSEMTTAVERLKDWSAKELGLTLPDADHIQSIIKMQNEVEKNQKWL